MRGGAEDHVKQTPAKHTEMIAHEGIFMVPEQGAVLCSLCLLAAQNSICFFVFFI